MQLPLLRLLKPKKSPALTMSVLVLHLIIVKNQLIWTVICFTSIIMTITFKLLSRTISSTLSSACIIRSWKLLTNKLKTNLAVVFTLLMALWHFTMYQMLYMFVSQSPNKNDAAVSTKTKLYIIILQWSVKTSASNPLAMAVNESGRVRPKVPYEY